MTAKRSHWRRSGVFIVNFEHISLFSSVFVVDFEQVHDCWVSLFQTKFQNKCSKTSVQVCSSNKGKLPGVT